MNENKYYDEIKELIVNNEINKVVKNHFIIRSDLETKYNIGKLLSEAGKNYGENIIKKFSVKLTNEFGKGYSERNLRNFRQLYTLGPIWQTLFAKLTWSQIIELLWINNPKEINYYIDLINKTNLNVRDLKFKIKNKEYERLSDEAKNKLISNEALNIKDTIPEPVLIPISKKYDKEKLNEKLLHTIIVDNIKEFMKQLGNGYSFIEDEYRIKIGNKFNFIDLLLFNYIYNCFVIIELKVTELKKEYFSQIKVYMNYIDKYLKKDNHNKTIGILLVKENNGYVLYYSDGNIIPITFELKNI